MGGPAVLGGGVHNKDARPSRTGGNASRDEIKIQHDRNVPSTSGSQQALNEASGSRNAVRGMGKSRAASSPIHSDVGIRRISSNGSSHIRDPHQGDLLPWTPDSQDNSRFPTVIAHEYMGTPKSASIEVIIIIDATIPFQVHEDQYHQVETLGKEDVHFLSDNIYLIAVVLGILAVVLLVLVLCVLLLMRVCSRLRDYPPAEQVQLYG